MLSEIDKMDSCVTIANAYFLNQADCTYSS